MNGFSQDDAPLEEAPNSYVEDAEAVRAHLVSLRGGALFLSPADTIRLLGWFDKGIRVADVLRALERSAEARAKKRTRVPFGLGQASRYLGKQTKGVFRSPNAPDVDPGNASGLAPLTALIRHRAAGDPQEQRLRAVASDLGALALVEPDQAAKQAMIRVRMFHDRCWDALSPSQQKEVRSNALEQLGDLVHLVDEDDLQPIIEESARAITRERYQWLCAASVWDLLAPEAS
ncbi:MAG: hypothetical protein GWP91_02405 [Rhodobacterales bacterium]|nr:hypothetical protein [Rhodobacterales bacterium]